MRNQVFKKLFSALLALIMVAGLLPASVLAEGWTAADVDSTPAPAETVQPTESAEPTEPAETETPGVTEVPEPTPENPATMDEPTAEPAEGEEPAEPMQEETPAPEEGILLAAETGTANEINYVTKEKPVPLPDAGAMGYRIVHIDCGRKYFSEAQIKQIIDYAYDYGYTHVELAFGNDGLRFMLNDMSVTANGTTYLSDSVKSAIQTGNDEFDKAASNSSLANSIEELTQSEMDNIISYAKTKGIGIIPMFDAPGHLYAVITAMNKIFGSNISFSNPSDSGKSPNMAIDPTEAASVNFVQALMKKYIEYFAKNGCKIFNIAADECGFSKMDVTKYTAYVKLVNSMAAMVQNAGMTALAFNDGIYYNNLKSSVEFDTNIAICYWTAGTNYASAATLADKDFKIINTNTHWYYVIGSEKSTGTEWKQYAYHHDYAVENMSKTGSCLKVDGDNNETVTPVGCMAAIWCDNPSESVKLDNVKSYIAALKTGNPDYFKAAPVPTVSVKAESEANKNVTVDATKDESGATKVTLKNNVAEGESYTLQLGIDNAAEGAVFTWKSDNEKVATVDGNGLVTFVGSSGTVTITATPEAATKDEIAAGYSITFSVAKDGEIAPVTKEVTVTIGATFEDKIEGDVSNNIDETKYNSSIATYTIEVKDVTASAGDPVKQETIQAGGKYIIGDNNGNYIKLNGTTITNTNNQDEATEWTIESNTQSGTAVWNIKSGNYYLSYYNNNSWGLYVKTSAEQVSWAYDGTGFKYFKGSNYLRCNNSKWTVSTTNSNRGAAYVKGTPTEAGKQTTVTIKGVAEGDTTVTIGHVTYNVHVTKEDLTNVSPLPVQTWITNNVVESSESTTGNSYWAATWSRDTNNGNAYFVNLKPEDVYGKEGKSITECMPNELTRYEFGGTYWEKAKDNKAPKNLYVWRGLVHNTNSIQKIYGADYSNIGTEFNYIRYYGGKWEVSIDRTENSWIQVYGYNSISGNNVEQIAVYYMMRTEITTEVKTDVADWGYTKTDDKYSEQIGKNSYVILDFAVKIDGAERKPNNFPQDGKTFVFHCDENKDGVITSGNTRYRQLNNFRAVETLQEGYEVYMVTVTMTSGNSSETISDTTSYTYDETTEQIIWAIDEETKVNSRLDGYKAITSGDTTYSGCKVGGDPYIRGIEVYNQHGALITYYIRYKAEEGKLTVRYFDATSGIENAKEIHNYSIGVANIDTDIFNRDIRLNDTDWKGNLLNGSVVNKNGDTVTVSADLSTMSSIDPQYRYAKDYKCIRVDCKDEGKEVWLYYTFSSNVTYVVDFGIPLVIKPEDMSEELVNAKITSVTVDANTSYADITVDETNYSITYKLNKMINSEDAIVVSYTGINKDSGNLGKVSYTVTIIPATTVYYEDSFAKFYGADKAEQKKFDASSDKDEAGVWYIDGETATVDQALEALGQENHNPYGYDPAYNNCTMFSMGSARKVTVTSEMANNWDNTTSAWPTAQFTFKGTGFDIISMTDNTSGAIFVDVVNAETGAKAKSVFVDNYYGYTYNETNGWQPSTNNEPNALYQIPVIAVRGLEYAEYNVVIKVAYNTFFDHTTPKGSYSFWLDAVRVYNPAGNELDTEYGKDSEAKPVYTEVRKALIGQGNFVSNDATNVEGAVFIDGKATGATIEDYTNYGPNHEVYLAQGQAIAFKIVADSEPKTVQLGVKLANGESGTLNIGGDGIKFAAYNDKEAANSLTLGTATDMYYALTGLTWNAGTGEQSDKKVSNLIVLTNSSAKDAANIISITNVKCTFEAAQEAETNTVALAISYDDALMAVSMVNNLLAPEPEPEPEKTFEPERFEASWTKNVMQGRKATLNVKTSEDVEAITVDGQTVSSYRTRTERVGFGRRAKRITYREFTYSMVAQETADFSITAINAEGIESEAITARLTVQKRPSSVRDVWNWFKGWF